MDRHWHEDVAPSLAVVAFLTLILCSACGFHLQIQPLLLGVGEVEITGELDPEFRRVLQRTIDDNRSLADSGLKSATEVTFKVNFISSIETITHLRFDEFREPLQSELEITCRILIAKGKEPGSEKLLVNTRRYNYNRDYLLAVTAELQDAREDMYREFSRRIVVLLAEMTEGQLSNDGQ